MIYLNIVWANVGAKAQGTNYKEVENGAYFLQRKSSKFFPFIFIITTVAVLFFWGHPPC
jgi:hypothetical protein